jgi:hypothetical protein
MTPASRPKSFANTGFTVNTLRLWKAKYAGMDVSDVVKLKQLEAENAQMQRIITRQTLKMDELMPKYAWVHRSDKTR